MSLDSGEVKRPDGEFFGKVVDCKSESGNEILFVKCS